MTKKIFIQELKKELSMRKKVWTMTDRTNDRFLKKEHQDRYDTLKRLTFILDNQTPNEIEQLYQTAKKRQQARQIKQSNLF